MNTPTRFEGPSDLSLINVPTVELNPFHAFAAANEIYSYARGLVCGARLAAWYKGAMVFATGDADISRTEFAVSYEERAAFGKGERGRVPQDIIIAARGARSAAA